MRVGILFWGACLAASVGVSLGQGDEEVCQVDGTGCPPGDMPEEVAEDDGIAKDIHRICPGSRWYIRNLVQGSLKWLGRRSNFQKLVGLWPQDVLSDGWSDDYTRVIYVFVARVMLGLYKTRGPEYVRLPTAMVSEGSDDIIRVESIGVPHLDVDGSPNFYWFEKWLPSIVMKFLYVPSVTCFYSTLRRMSTDNNELNGTFMDDIHLPDFNTWESAMKGTSFQRKVDWVAAFYGSAKAWDGEPLWPKRMTNFQNYLRHDEWDDGLETAFAFHLIGSHRLEHGTWSFTDLPGIESLTLPFRLPLNIFANFAVREHFGRYGADMYFTEDGMPALVETPTGDKVLRGDKQWQYWKFVWRSTLITAITFVDHLHIAHFRSANLFARVSREAMEPDFPLRRISTIFSFGSIFVNLQAIHTLAGPNHMLHRATPFKEFAKLSNVVPAQDSQIVPDIVDIPAVRVLLNKTEFDSLHPKIQNTPFFSDGLLVMDAIRKLVASIIDVSYEPALCPGGMVDPNLERVRRAFDKEFLESNYKVNKEAQELSADKNPCGHSKFWNTLKARLASYFFVATGWHRHVGFVGDYYLDPEIASMSWKDGERWGRPKQHIIMTVINVFTSSHQPLLKEDYTYLFQGMKPDLSMEYTAIWQEFQRDLADIEKVIDERNAKRSIVNYNMHPGILESSVSK